MAERKVDVDTINGTTDGNIEVKEIETRADRKARLAQVFERGVVGDRLHVPLPPDKHGEWVPDNGPDIMRKKSLGFWIDTEFAPSRALHDKGDSASYVGDCVFMVCERETKEIIDEIRRDRYNAIHAPKGGKQHEEKEYNNVVNGADGPIIDSKVHKAKLTDIADALKAASTQAIK